jgi:hypothetical protein
MIPSRELNRIKRTVHHSGDLVFFTSLLAYFPCTGKMKEAHEIALLLVYIP